MEMSIERDPWRIAFGVLLMIVIVGVWSLICIHAEKDLKATQEEQVRSQLEGLWWNERYDTNAIAEIRERLDRLEHKQVSTHQAGPSDASIDLSKEKEWRGRLEWKFVDPSTGTTDTVAPRLEPRP